MPLDQFTVLPLDEQLAILFESGTLVATRWQEVDEAINLYELPDRFFAEITYNTTRNELLELFNYGREHWGRLPMLCL
jgi:hypothetical protein